MGSILACKKSCCAIRGLTWLPPCPPVLQISPRSRQSTSSSSFSSASASSYPSPIATPNSPSTTNASSNENKHAPVRRTRTNRRTCTSPFTAYTKSMRAGSPDPGTATHDTCIWETGRGYGTCCASALQCYVDGKLLRPTSTMAVLIAPCRISADGLLFSLRAGFV